MSIDLTELLSLPFFSASHADWATAVRGWTAAKGEIEEPRDQTALAALCRALVKELGAAGLLTPTVRIDDTARMDVRTLSLAREVLAYHCGLADFAFAMQGLGSGPISLFGTISQRQHYLPAIAAGDAIAAFALSEPGSGSDVAHIETTARDDGDYFILDGEKTWISNAGIADQYVVFARTGETPGAKGISAFIVEAGTPGFTVPTLIDVIAPHPLGTLRFAGCRVPRQNLVGEQGQGFAVAMATLDMMRSTVGAAANGMARRAMDTTIDHVLKRQLFGKPLAALQGTQFHLAEMAARTEAAELLVYRAAWLKDNGKARISREAAIAKMESTESAQRTIDGAVQLAGGLGVVHGSVQERLYREIRALRIYEGATEVQKVIIANAILRQGTQSAA